MAQLLLAEDEVDLKSRICFKQDAKEDARMARKYEHFIKHLGAEVLSREKKRGGQTQPGTPAAGPGGAQKEIVLRGRDQMEGLDLNISWGIHNGLGDWHMDGQAYSHSFPEWLFFVGLDTANVNYLGAEIECCLGSEKETYTFNEPTVVIAPAGLCHAPIATKKLFSPKGFGFISVGLNGISGDGGAGEKRPSHAPVPATGKYSHLVKSMKPSLIIERGKLRTAGSTPEQLAKHEEMQRSGFKPGPGNPDHLTWMSGEDLGGAKLNVAWGFCSQPGIWQRGVDAHVHPADQVLMFLGTDPNSDNLGAEIEIDLGTEHERYLVNKSSALICPAGLPHAPIVTRWVDKPFAFLLFNLAADMTMTFA